MSLDSDKEFRGKLLQLICEHGASECKMLKRFSVEWHKDDDGAIFPSRYTIEWKYKDQVKKRVPSN